MIIDGCTIRTNRTILVVVVVVTHSRREAVLSEALVFNDNYGVVLLSGVSITACLLLFVCYSFGIVGLLLFVCRCLFVCYC